MHLITKVLSQMVDCSRKVASTRYRASLTGTSVPSVSSQCITGCWLSQQHGTFFTSGQKTLIDWNCLSFTGVQFHPLFRRFSASHDYRHWFHRAPRTRQSKGCECREGRAYLFDLRRLQCQPQVHVSTQGASPIRAVAGSCSAGSGRKDSCPPETHTSGLAGQDTVAGFPLTGHMRLVS